MLIRRCFLTLLAISVITAPVFGQPKSFNNCVAYANQSAEEVSAVVSAIATYYPGIFEKKSWNVPKFNCPIQQDDYYYKIAVSDVGVPQSVLTALKELRAAAEKVDAKCKALDTYHKLEDYKTDSYAAAKTMVDDIRVLVDEYSRKQVALTRELDKSYAKLNLTHSYTKTADVMRKQLARERAFLDRWKFNLKEEVPTGWITDELQRSIVETDEALKAMRAMKPVLNYPASSMWPSFLEALNSILETKRRGLDEYNFEAKKSDKHQNDVYLSLINYYNGALLSDYNTFVQFGAQDKFQGLKAIKYVALFEINDQPVSTEVTVTPFKDMSKLALKLPPPGTALSNPAFVALTNYVDFINETFRQISHHRDVIRNLNSSAATYVSLTSYAGRGGLNFSHDDFKVPLSHYQKTISESKALPSESAATLNMQAEVLLNICQEMDQLGAALEGEVNGKKYEKDKLKKLYSFIERTVTLFEVWDERKELLYEDVQKLFDAHKTADTNSSWYKSGVALRELTALDHDGLFKAKAYYKGMSSGPISTAMIDAKLRAVLANEYENMKGIEKYGRSNGLCPYSPYEDVPKSSKTLSEYLQALKPAKGREYGYQHPYHSMIYMYNDVVEQYNKFCELSPVPHLKYIKQPELFTVIPPDAPKPTIMQEPLASTPPQEHSQVKNELKEEVKLPKEAVPEGKSKEATSAVIRDTVYIEKRDTIYLHDPNENVRSMDGYAANNMVLLLDVSGSMNSAEKLPLLKKSVLDMLSMMRQQDEISIVVFSGKPKTLLAPMSFREQAKITKAINALKPSGTTDGNAGLKLAYKVADENYIRGGNNRIVLATDGEFPISAETESLIRKFSEQDIFLTIFYFGKKSGSAKNLERIASLGRGNYEFISKENVDIKLIREAKAKRER